MLDRQKIIEVALLTAAVAAIIVIATVLCVNVYNCKGVTEGKANDKISSRILGRTVMIDCPTLNNYSMMSDIISEHEWVVE